MRRLLCLALLAFAPQLHAQAQSITGPPGAYVVTTTAPTTVERGDGWIRISWGTIPPGPNPTPTPTPIPPVPTPTPIPPGPVKHADFLILLMDDAAMTPALADVKNSASLRGALAPTKVTVFSAGTPDYARYQPFLASKHLAPPLYLFMSGQTVLGSGTITTETDILDAAANLR